MSDAITLVMARKISLKFARSALKSGSTAELKSALKGLPSNGRKAEDLRLKIVEALALRDDSSEKRLVQESVKAACVADGIEYEFAVAEFSDVAFFRAARRGAIVMITVNSAHPFGTQIAEGERLLDPLLMSLLAAWAHYELDQVSPKRQAAVSDARTDWGRILRRIVSSSEGFSVNGSS